jgi:Secretion system C-terminal sorting domain/PKD-like domain
MEFCVRKNETMSTYTLTNWSSSCYETPELTPVTAGTLTWNATNQTISIQWLATWSTIATLKITKKASAPQTCGDTRNFTIFPKILQSQTVISGPNELPIGTPFPVGDYTATTNFQFRGTLDPNPFVATTYTWLLSDPNWSFVPTTPVPTGRTAKIKADLSDACTISAYPSDGCSLAGPTEFPGTLTVTRRLPSPCDQPPGITGSFPTDPNIGPYVLCGSTAVIGLSANVNPLQSIGTTPNYTWTLPQGWTFLPGTPTNLSSVFVVPSGTNGGTVTVTASAYNLTSAPCSLTFSLRTLIPGTEVVGLDRICQGQSGTYNLSVATPPNVTTEWSVTTPTGGSATGIIPNTGTGTSATINGGSAEGTYRIIFKAGNTACGYQSVFKDFVVGRPVIAGLTITGPLDGIYPSTIKWDGNFLFGCPGQYTLNASILGATSGCVQWTSLNPSIPLIPTFNCLTTSFILPNNFSSYAIKATLTNECGSRDYIIIIVQRPANECTDDKDLVHQNDDQLTQATVEVVPIEVDQSSLTAPIVPKNTPRTLLFPNPAQEILFVVWDFDQGTLTDQQRTISIFDMTGRLVKNIPNASDNMTEIDVSNMTSGIYTIQLKTGDVTTSHKVSITHN